MDERSQAGRPVDLRSGLGVMLPMGPGAVDRWCHASADFARLDKGGCSAIWLTDHLFWGVDVPEALSMAGVAVGATRRCAVGTGVLQLPLRRPAAVAKAATTLHLASGGRFVLGLGTGEHRGEYELAGADFDTRGPTTDRYLSEMVDLWQPGASPYEQRPAPGLVPMWFGGRGRAALRRVATHGQGWLPIFVTPERFAEGAATLESLLDTAGRSRRDITLGAVVIAAVTDESWRRVDALEWMAKLWSLDPGRFDRHLVSGTANECVAAMQGYIDAGVDHVTVLPASPEPVPTFLALADAFRVGRVPGPDQLAGV